MSEEEKTSRFCRRCQWNDPYLSKYLDTSTIGGLHHVFRGSSKIRRVLWALIFLGAIIGLITMISFSLRRFIQRPSASTITVISLDEEGTPFPGVTICNLNLERNFSNVLSNSTYEVMNYLFNPDESFELSGLNSSQALQSCHRTVSNSSPTVQNTTIWNSQNPNRALDNLIHYCGFVEGIDQHVIPCKNEFQPVLTSAGICYTFNGTSRVVKSTGVRYGLKLVLNIDQEARPSFNGKSGVSVIVHDGRDIARPNLYGINVPPGQGINVGVRRRVSDDDTEEAHCIEDADLPFFERFRYSQFACRQNAIIEHIARDSTCGCVLQPNRPSTGAYVNTPNCTFNQLCCLLEQYSTFNPELNCLLPCVFPFYEYSSSYSQFPSGRYLDSLMDATNQTEEEIRNNFLSVNVFVDDLQVTTTVTQYTFGLPELLGEIGGLMGLFLAISVISLLELLVLLLDEIKRIFCVKKVRETVLKVENKIALPDIEAGTAAEEEKEKETNNVNNEKEMTV